MIGLLARAIQTVVDAAFGRAAIPHGRTYMVPNPPKVTPGGVDTHHLRVLDCGHYTYRRVIVGGEVTCSYCGEETTVTSVR